VNAKLLKLVLSASIWRADVDVKLEDVGSKNGFPDLESGPWPAIDALDEEK
jgi:hypothetical protein